jgi:chloride channel 3/4/5
LKLLNPTGTGKLVLFETKYGIEYEPVHYLVFIVLGVVGGIFGGLFCKLNFIWSKHFRKIPLIKRNPVFEVGLVVLATALLQFPNPLTREPGDIIIKNLLVDCSHIASKHSFVCLHEVQTKGMNWIYIGWLTYGTLAKLVLTIITFGCKVPSGVIIPALDAGALFGRLVGYVLPYTPNDVSPGIFALVGAAAFLAGVSRMTISLAVIMFELTGELQYAVPNMITILIAKWVADAISAEGVYDLAQSVLGHPFLDPDVALQIVRRKGLKVSALIPPKKTMDDITVHVPPSNIVPTSLLRRKLDSLKRRGLMDAGLVLVQTHPPSTIPVLQGYLSQAELAFGLSELSPHIPLSPSQQDYNIRLLGHTIDDVPPDHLEVDLSPFVDRTPLSICREAPLEYAVEMFGKLGLRYLCVTEEGTGRLVGVIIKKRLVGFIEELKEE